MLNCCQFLKYMDIILLLIFSIFRVLNFLIFSTSFRFVVFYNFFHYHSIRFIISTFCIMNLILIINMKYNMRTKKTYIGIFEKLLFKSKVKAESISLLLFTVILMKNGCTSKHCKIHCNEKCQLYPMDISPISTNTNV